MWMQVQLKNDIVGINSANAQQKSVHTSLLQSSMKFCCMSKCKGVFCFLNFIFQADSTSIIS